MKTIYHALNRLSFAVSWLTSSLGAIMIALCFLALVFQVAYRFVLVKIWAFSFPFTEEFARYALVWSCYLCIACCLREGQQASVNFLYDRLAGWNKKILFILSRVLMWVFLLVAIYYGYLLIARQLHFRSATMQLPGIFIFSAPFVGSVLMGYETLVEVLGVLCGELEPFAGRPMEKTDETYDMSNYDDLVKDMTTKQE